MNMHHGEKSREPFTELDFSSIRALATSFANHIESHFEKIADILLDYESFEVVQDETGRTLDLLKSLDENKDFFVLRIDAVTSFLPRNQPLYAFACFVIIPSLMASEAHFRIPNSMRQFFPRLLQSLRISEFFPNIYVSSDERLKFLAERSALFIDPKTKESRPVTDAVVFTGTSFYAERLRLVFDKRTLFIANGSGHNPVIVAEDADIEKAVEAALTLQLYNQGQDCAAPNAILVHAHVAKAFMRVLHEQLKKVRVGHYHDRSCRVGPISELEDLQRIQTLLVKNREWLDPRTPGIIRTSDALVEPTIVNKPLKEGGNFAEVFSPIMFVQQYDDDQELSLYFEHPHYARNAMYITVYGTSAYIDNLIDKPIEGKVLHDRASVLRDTHLHAPGVERGVNPYGGYGYAASSFSIHNKFVCCPTLPQRDIYEQLVKPLLAEGEIEKRKSDLNRMTEILMKDVQKLLGLKKADQEGTKVGSVSGRSYVDSLDITANDDQRYVELEPARLFTLLDHPNAEYISSLEPKHLEQIRALRKFLSQKRKLKHDEFKNVLYSIAKKPDASESENKAEQLAFFQNIYQLLLGRNSGPRLAQFLLDTDRQHTLRLLDV